MSNIEQNHFDDRSNKLKSRQKLMSEFQPVAPTRRPIARSPCSTFGWGFRENDAARGKEYSKDRRLRPPTALGRVTERQVELELRILAAKSAHRVAGVASFILLADIGDQHLWALYLDFESGDQRVSASTTTCPVFP